MTAPPEPEYHKDKESLLVVFDLRDARAEKSLRLQAAALAELGSVTFLDRNHAVLVARFAGTQERAA